MVVISAGVTSKTEILVSRQFVPITRHEIEGLYLAFLRLIEIESKDRTFIETDTARFVYKPLEDLYVVTVTNLDSNILEDFETIKFIQQVVQAYCKNPVLEQYVVQSAFDIIFALDEVITLGYRENVTLNQIKAYTEMESIDEKLSLMVEEEKIKEERRRGQEIAARLSLERREKAKIEKNRSKTKLGFTPPISAATDTHSMVDISLPAIESQSVPQTFSNKGMNLKKNSSSSLVNYIN